MIRTVLNIFNRPGLAVISNIFEFLATVMQNVPDGLTEPIHIKIMQFSRHFAHSVLSQFTMPVVYWTFLFYTTLAF